MSSTRILSILAVALFVGLPPVHAQTSGAVIPDRNYQLLREDEDWSFLRDPALRQDFWDPIKYIPLRRNSPDWYLTISGEVREVWEQTGNNNWGEQPFWNNFFLERYMLGFNAHYGKHFRTFVEFKSGLESFRIGGPRRIDEKKLDFQNAFLDVGTGSEQNWVTLRVGVQELEYGAGRLIDVREGPNVRLSFIGLRILSKVGSKSPGRCFTTGCWSVGINFNPDPSLHACCNDGVQRLNPCDKKRTSREDNGSHSFSIRLRKNPSRGQPGEKVGCRCYGAQKPVGIGPS